MRVLIVEDEPMMEALLRATLEPLGHELFTLSQGAGFEAALERFDPDVVLLDVLLPGEEDGFALAERLRALKGERPYVVMLTALDDLESRKRALAAGANAYLSKPFSPLRLLRLIEDRAQSSPGSGGAL